jgi:UDP-glucose 4-epimerase
MESLCNLYRANFGLEMVGLRYFSVYGPRQRPDMAFHRLFRAALHGGTFEVFGDGGQTRDFTYVSDIVAATRSAAVAAPRLDGRTINIGGGSPASLREAISIVETLAGRPLSVRYRESDSGDVRDSAADTSLAREHLGFRPEVGLADGLGRQFAWLSDEVKRGRW